MLRDRQHTIRRNIGEIEFSQVKGYKRATSISELPEKIRILVEAFIENNLRISVLEMGLGRRELEEFITSQADPKYNKLK